MIINFSKVWLNTHKIHDITKMVRNIHAYIDSLKTNKVAKPSIFQILSSKPEKKSTAQPRSNLTIDLNSHPLIVYFCMPALMILYNKLNEN